MNINHYFIEDQQIYVINDMLLPSEVDEFYNYIVKLPFLKQERDNDQDDHPSFSLDLKPKEFELKMPMGNIARKLISKFYPEKDYILFRVAVNLMTKGDMEVPHYDCLPQRDDVTLLYYINKEWEHTWGGETLFYNQGDTELGILPKPGRFVIFPGIVEHKAGIPSRLAKDVRYTLALKYTSRSNFKLHE